MYTSLLQISSLILVISAAAAVFVWAVGHHRKSSAEHTVRLSVQSGDNESMDFTTNVRRAATEQEKRNQLSFIYDAVTERRAQNHAAYLKIKAEAIRQAEDEKAQAEAEGKPYDPKLRSIAEGKTKGV